ncbi:MAG: AMP-binding protein [Polyangiaceae bacterium]|nr:AMP-binding protein [Polyangiaceae bacterium]
MVRGVAGGVVWRAGGERLVAPDLPWGGGGGGVGRVSFGALSLGGAAGLIGEAGWPLAALFALLARYGGQPELWALVEPEGGGWAVVQAPVGAGATVAGVAAAAGEALAAATAGRAVPLDEFVAELGGERHVFVSFSGAAAPLGPAGAALALHLASGGVELCFDRGALGAEFARRFADNLRYVIEGLAAGGGGRLVAELEVVCPAERRELEAALTGPVEPFPTHLSFATLFGAAAREHRDRVAVSWAGGELSYGALAERASAIAGWLRARGLRRGEFVAVMAARGGWFLAAVLGVFEAGGAYVPVGADYPPARIEYVFEHAEARCALVDRAAFERLARGDFGSRRLEAVCVLDGDVPVGGAAALRRQCALRALRGAGPIELDAALWAELEPQAARLASGLRGRAGTLVHALVDDPALAAVVSLACAMAGKAAAFVGPEGLPPEGPAPSGVAVGERARLSGLEDLAWQHPSCEGYVLLDANDGYPLGERGREESVGAIWEAVAQTSYASDNDYGWTSAFTGERFSQAEVDQYRQNVVAKAGPLLGPSSRVLEVGCGHGLVAFALAPLAGAYLATDLSTAVVARNRRKARALGLRNLRFQALAAADVGELAPKRFDVVVLSSCVHYFPNLSYLRRCVAGCVGLIDGRGAILLDDLLDARKKARLVAETRRHREQNPRARTKVAWGDDLFVAPAFFDDLACDLPGVVGVEVSPKRGDIANELTEYRYDVLLRVDRGVGLSSVRGPRHKLALGLPELAADVGARPPEGVRLVERSVEVQAAGGLAGGGEPAETSGADRAYMIYTSGTTGQPKGAVVRHDGMVNHLFAKLRDFGIDGRDVVVQNASTSFDISVWQYLAALLVGARVHVIDDAVAADPRRLVDEVAACGATVLELVPSMLSAVLETMSGPASAALGGRLRHVLSTGEPLPAPLAARFFERLPGVRLGNVYGPTEASDDITHAIFERAPAAEGYAPVGYPIANLMIELLNEAGRPTPLGGKGELYVSGVGVGEGYFRDEAKTAGAFSRRAGGRAYRTGDLARYTPGGGLQVLGRADGQVKVRGFRVELGEVEAALLRAPGVELAAACALADGAVGVRLVALVQAGADFDAVRARAALARALPPYMVPSEIRAVGRLPLSPNGKIDRHAAAELVRSGGPGAVAGAATKAPRTEVERRLLRCWGATFAAAGCEPGEIGVDDDFFALGGHSLLAVRLLDEVRREFGVELPLRLVLERPTVERMAHALDERAAVRSGDGLVVPLASAKAGAVGGGRVAFHPVGGGLVCYAELARLWEGLVDFWGVESPLLGVGAPAEAPPPGRYAAELGRAGLADAPVLLGWSFGGFLAHSVAGALPPARRCLVLIDPSWPGEVAGEGSWPALVEGFARELFGGGEWSASWGGFASEGEALGALLQAAIERGALPPGLSPKALGRLYGAYAAHVRSLCAAAVPPRAAGVEAIAFVARATPGAAERAAFWRATYGPSLRICEVEGGHYNLLRGPALRRLADAIDEFVDAFEGGA